MNEKKEKYVNILICHFVQARVESPDCSLTVPLQSRDHLLTQFSCCPAEAGSYYSLPQDDFPAIFVATLCEI